MNKYKYVIYKYNCVRYILYECLSEEYEEFLHIWHSQLNNSTWILSLPSQAATSKNANIIIYTFELLIKMSNNNIQDFVFLALKNVLTIKWNNYFGLGLW